MTKREIYDLCEISCPGYGIEPILMMAIVEQESAYLRNAIRMEPAFWRKYTKPQSLDDCSEILLAVSFGLTQLMGQSLKELNYFEFFLKYYNDRHNFTLRDPFSEVTIIKALNAYLVRPSWHIERGCQWYKVKEKIARGSVEKTLLYWNGGGNKNYPAEVLARADKLSEEFK